MIILSGGTGTPKLLVGLKRVFKEEELNIIVNTAEDVWIAGNLVCPDVDSVIYALAGQIDKDKWWGVRNDSFFTHSALERLDYDEQMMIGDKDRATHIIRSELLRRGASLTEAIDSLATRSGITATILPMTDDIASVSTKILTPAGKLHFQEFWVAKKGEPEVLDVCFDGIERAKPSEDVMNVLDAEEVVLIGPSNPITSIGPILSLSGVREILKHKKVVAISPIIGNNPISGPAGKFMRAKGFEVSPFGVFKCYEDFLDVLVIDESDESQADKEVEKTDIMIRNDADSERLARFIRELLGNM
ncbi:2-phospho-L-lactate transferase [ANME-1 cluster archaeon GoMg2]|nr:2-phospho-L-lactate transferase [ANME-1 cluster archaeon GoMg2]